MKHSIILALVVLGLSLFSSIVTEAKSLSFKESDFGLFNSVSKSFYQNRELVSNISVCAQVITPAIEPKTGKCYNFPTPCSVPKGWIRIEGGICPIDYVPGPRFQKGIIYQ